MVELFGIAMSAYTLIMLTFFVFLIAVLILGDIGDFFDVGGDIDTDVDTGLSPISLPVVGVFGAAFGGYGTIFEGLGYGTFLTPILSAVLATATAGGSWVLMYNFFVKTQAETRVDLTRVVGETGQVLVPIHPGHAGQIVVVTQARGRTLLQAIADETIGTDEPVVVESIIGDSVKVRRA